MDKTFECITFDLWQTLIIDQPNWGKIRSDLRINTAFEILKSSGKNFEHQQISSAYTKCFEECEEIRKNGLDISFRAQVNLFLSFIQYDLDNKLDESSIRQIMNEYGYAFYEAPPVLAKGAIELLDYATFKQYKIGLISNSGMTPGIIVKAYLEQIGILEFFHSMVFSDELLVSKPAKKIFMKSLIDLQVMPEDAIHVGDNLETDIHGAISNGLDAIWIKGYDTNEVITPPTYTINSLLEIKDIL
jgi:putative hydrolase of the HAD superfamily